MENSTISAPEIPDFAGQNQSQTHHNHHLEEPDLHPPPHHHHVALPSTSILLIVIPIFIIILLLAILLLVIMLRKLQSHKSHGSSTRSGGSSISNKDCMFIAHSSINMSSSPGRILIIFVHLCHMVMHVLEYCFLVVKMHCRCERWMLIWKQFK